MGSKKKCGWLRFYEDRLFYLDLENSLPEKTGLLPPVFSFFRSNPNTHHFEWLVPHFFTTQIYFYSVFTEFICFFIRY